MQEFFFYSNARDVFGHLPSLKVKKGSRVSFPGVKAALVWR
jgi:hypothetical protein